MPTLRELLASRLRDALTASDLDSARADVSQAADPRFGDYQANAAMVLAKEKKANPRQLASEILSKTLLSLTCSLPLESVSKVTINLFSLVILPSHYLVIKLFIF